MLSLRLKCSVIFCLFIIVGGLFVTPRPAQAIFGIGDFTTIVANIPEWIKDGITKALKTVVAVAYKNGLQYFANKVAYDTANWLATGGEGGKPGFITKGWRTYLFGKGGIGDEALGEFLTSGMQLALEQATPFTPLQDCTGFCPLDVNNQRVCPPPATDPFYGAWDSCQQNNSEIQARNLRNAQIRGRLSSQLSICGPLSAELSSKIQLMARKILEPTRPKCTATQLIKNLGESTIIINGISVRSPNFRNLQMSDLPTMIAYYDPSQSALGAVLQIVAEGKRVQAEAVEAGKYERLSTGGLKPVRDFITGENKIPDDLAGKQLEDALIRQPTMSIYREFTGEVVADAIGTFTSTLVSKMIERVLKKGFNPALDRSLASFGPQSGILGSTQGASLQFADILQSDFTEGPGVLLADLASDGSGPENRVISENFRVAIENKLTLTEATSFGGPCPRCQNWISLNATFGFNENGTQPDWRTDLPYRSIVILRKHRIVPVGWEIAALHMKNFGGERKTLGQLMQEYDCAGGSDYCGLVDPNWVLKAPVSKCYRYGPGELNLAARLTPICNEDTNGDGIVACPPQGDDIAAPPIQRNEYCADQRTCVVELPGGGCATNGFQQCIEERMVWTTDAQRCPAYFASCQQYSKRGTGESGTYLANTTDGAGCVNDTSLGCRRYATVKDPATGAWRSSTSAAENYYLNAQAMNAADSTCGGTASSGCREYVRVSHTGGSQPAYTVAEYQSLISSAPAGGYFDPTRNVETLYYDDNASLCSAQYVGCNLFTSTDASGAQVTIPAMPVYATIDPATGQVTNWNDECPAECVGYASFEQLATGFEPGIPLGGVNFIPSTAATCQASDVGCDEFTNQTTGQKEYYSALRACTTGGTPGGASAVQYTWQGSDTTGYQLKVWSLLPATVVDANNPVVGAPYVSGPKLSRVDPTQGWNGIDCRGDFNSASPDPDCREFIDPQLNYYYRYFSMTTVVSGAGGCHTLNRTLGGTYQADTSLSVQCSASAAGCREYRGGSGGNAAPVFSDTFEGGSYAPWGATGSVEISTESVLRNNHSLKISGTVAERSGVSLENGKVYVLTLWAKSDTGGTLSLTIGALPQITSLGSQSIGTEWRQYTYGPVTASNLPANSTLQALRGGGAVFIDNVAMQTASIYAIKDSWNTPAICDQPSPGFHVGCGAYQSNGGQSYFRGFSNLCPQEYVGCEALIDTQNSSAPGAASYYAGTAAAINVPADALVYLAPSGEASCSATQVGCNVFGQASLRGNGAAIYKDTVIKVDPDTFGDATQQPVAGGMASNCAATEEYCAEWDPIGVASSPMRFKDPTGLTCEYKTENTVSGWYQTGSTALCPGVTAGAIGHCIGGPSISANLASRDANQCQTDADCLDYSRPGGVGTCSSSVGLCSSEYSTCTEFQDPQSPKGCLGNLRFGQRACLGNATSICRSDTDCGGTDTCGLQACDTLFLPTKDLRGALGACTAVNPEIGCVGLHQVGGPPDTISTTPRCQNNPTQSCTTPADCGNSPCGFY